MLVFCARCSELTNAYRKGITSWIAQINVLAET